MKIIDPQSVIDAMKALAAELPRVPRFKDGGTLSLHLLSPDRPEFAFSFNGIVENPEWKWYHACGPTPRAAYDACVAKLPNALMLMQQANALLAQAETSP